MVQSVTDTRITLTEAAKLFPMRNGKHPHIVTLRRWILTGSRGVKLKGSRIGGQWYTSADWVEEFIAAGTDRAMEGYEQPEQSGRPQVVSAAHTAAMGRLKRRYGIDVGDSNEAQEESEALPDSGLQLKSGAAGAVSGVLPVGSAKG